MRNARIWWVITLGALLAVAALPALREQARAQWLKLRWGDGPPDSAAAARFVDRRYPDDAEMLLADGINDGPRLRQAIAKGAGPAAWAAYVATLPDIPCVRVGGGGIDPEDEQGIRDMEKRVASDSPDAPTEQQARPVLEGLRGWEGADPQNGLPVALESIVLYSLHRDGEACSRWEQAGRLPIATAYAETVERALNRLYQRMGIPEVEALVLAPAIGLSRGGYGPRLRNGARIAVYEGRLAQMQARANDAVAWWNATADLGNHLAADGTDMGFLGGVGIQTAGAEPVWQWESDTDTGATGGPMTWTDPVSGKTIGYRLWYGPQHDFYVKAAGEGAAEELRDRLLRARVRVGLMIQRMPSPEAMTAINARVARAWVLPRLGLGAAVLLGELLLLFGLAGAARRREVDSATRMSIRGDLFVTAPLLLGVACLAYTWWTRGPDKLDSNLLVWLAPTMVAAGVLLLAGIAVRFTRREGAGTVAAWRGNLRHALPMTIALTALAYLALTASAVPVRRDATRYLREEETPLVRRLGPEWDRPSVPKDAWRAAYPPKGSGHLSQE